jgi:phenylacetate-CoA ligase
MGLRTVLFGVLFPGEMRRREETAALIAAHDPASGAELSALLEFAFARVPYYRSLFPGLSGAPDLCRWPVLTKDIVRREFRVLASDDPGAPGDRFVNHTGGSTGEPCTFLQDGGFKAWNRAVEDWFYREMLGVDPVESPKVSLWGSRTEVYGIRRSPRKRLRLWLANTALLNSYRMRPGEMDRFVAVINRVRPEVVKGYAGSLFEMARHIRERRLRVHRPRFLYSTAEMLQPEARQLMEEVFGAPVRNLYGSREAGAVAGECSAGRMHVFSFFNHVELVLPDGSPAPPSVAARILVTALRNRAMPLLRYEIGDTAAACSGPCPCGSALPAITSILGRYSDYFLAPDGSLVYGGYLRQVLFASLWIREYQVLQDERDALDIHYVRAGTVPEGAMAEIEGKIRRALGGAMRVRWHEDDELPRTPHGKLLHTCSRVHSNPSALYP